MTPPSRLISALRRTAPNCCQRFGGGIRDGFSGCGFTGVELSQHGCLDKWLAAGYHGEMGWMASHGENEAALTHWFQVDTARMDYLPDGADPEEILADVEKAYISRYALGRDYHKLMRGRLAKLAKKIAAELGGGHYRAFVDVHTGA